MRILLRRFAQNGMRRMTPRTPRATANASPTIPVTVASPFCFPVATRTAPKTQTAPIAMRTMEQGSPVMALRRPMRTTVAFGAGEGVCGDDMVRELGGPLGDAGSQMGRAPLKRELGTVGWGGAVR